MRIIDEIIYFKFIFFFDIKKNTERIKNRAAIGDFSNVRELNSIPIARKKIDNNKYVLAFSFL